jgi:hypothetical protein
MYDLAESCYTANTGTSVFLRAGRGQTFRLREAEPLPTSYGEDLYREIFGPVYEKTPA